jgi:hypothetical protein
MHVSIEDDIEASGEATTAKIRNANKYRCYAGNIT